MVVRRPLTVLFAALLALCIWAVNVAPASAFELDSTPTSETVTAYGTVNDGHVTVQMPLDWEAADMNVEGMSYLIFADYNTGAAAQLITIGEVVPSRDIESAVSELVSSMAQGATAVDGTVLASDTRIVDDATVREVTLMLDLQDGSQMMFIVTIVFSSTNTSVLATSFSATDADIATVCSRINSSVGLLDAAEGMALAA